MISSNAPPRRPRPRSVLPPLALAALLAGAGVAANGQGRVDVLRIGASGTLTGNADSPREKAGSETLHRFIKDETGLNNEILGQTDWQALAGKMAKGQLHLAVFQGFEFAWAQEKYPALEPLAVAVNIDLYPVACVLAQRNDPARDLTGLRGRLVSLPATSHGYLRLFVDRRCEANGKKAEAFFSRITSPDNVEDALDDVVDGNVQATVVDRAALEAYRRRKPGRFNRLKVVERSQPFPPAVVAYYGSTLDTATLRRFKDGLLGAARKERGEMLLTLCRLTGFETVPADFGRVLARTRKAYPANPGAK